MSGGVHSAFIDGHHVYLTDDATGSLRVIDFEDVKKPKEVGRVAGGESAGALGEDAEGEFTGGRYLHDVQVEGRPSLCRLLARRAGHPRRRQRHQGRQSRANPKLVSQLRFNYHELYGPGWLAGAHAVFRYKQYVFVGDEVFPAVFDITSRDVIPGQGHRPRR